MHAAGARRRARAHPPPPLSSSSAYPPSHPPNQPCPRQYTRKGDNATEAQALIDFARGLAGGAPVPRSKFLFDAVELPQVPEGCWGWGAEVPAGMMPACAPACLSAGACVPPHLLPPSPPPHPLLIRSSTTWPPRRWCSTRTGAPRRGRCCRCCCCQGGKRGDGGGDSMARPCLPSSGRPPCSLQNFFIYRDPSSGQWAMFPWDLESGEPAGCQQRWLLAGACASAARASPLPAITPLSPPRVLSCRLCHRPRAGREARPRLLHPG